MLRKVLDAKHTMAMENVLKCSPKKVEVTMLSSRLLAKEIE